jgi:hypothetical protein
MITNIDAKWVGFGYAKPQTWARKMDMPRFSPGVRAVRLEFRFEVAYVAINQDNEVLMAGNGGLESWCPIWDFHLNGFGRVIGPQDMAAAVHTPMAEAWRNCVAERIFAVQPASKKEVA